MLTRCVCTRSSGTGYMEHRSEEQDKVHGDQVKGFTENVMNNEF